MGRGEQPVSRLLALGYADESTAVAALDEVDQLEPELKSLVEDAAAVVRDENGKLKVHQSANLVAAGALGGGFWGLIFGLIFVAPLLGLLVGAVIGGVGGKLADIGIDDDFIDEIGRTLRPGSSALFLLLAEGADDPLIERLAPEGAHVLRTNLSTTDEEHLRAILHDTVEQVAPRGDADEDTHDDEGEDESPAEA